MESESSGLCTLFKPLIVLVLVMSIKNFAFEPNLHISQIMSLVCKMLDDVINMHNYTSCAEMLCKYFVKQVSPLYCLKELLTIEGH